MPRRTSRRIATALGVLAAVMILIGGILFTSDYPDAPRILAIVMNWM
jgi:hypothetical protein